MNHLGLSYPKKINQAVPANEYCGDYIPNESSKNGASLDRESDRLAMDRTLLANTEIYESYFAMYI